jgi:simple sugar transport system permease protein
LSEENKKNLEDKSTDKTEQSDLREVFVRKGTRRTFVIPLLAILTAMIIGAIIFVLTSQELLTVWKEDSVGNAIKETVFLVINAYVSLFEGAFGQPDKMLEGIKAFISNGDSSRLLEAFRPLGDSLVIVTPYIFAGLAVALGFRGGLFNIGAEGQLFVGALASTYVGYSIEGLGWYLHLPLALLAGILAGALWGAIPGILKAWTGAHEVINTIMMNYIAFRLVDFMLLGPMARPDGLPITEEIGKSAYLPALFPEPIRIHVGFFVALFVAWLVYWFLWKTKYGLEIRMVGANPNAARYAGIKVRTVTVLTMAISGCLAGLAGTVQILGIEHKMVQALSPGYGFDAIALALLGNSHPLGVVLASLLFGFLRGGTARMHSVAGVSEEIIKVIQALIIIFIAAPEIVRKIYGVEEEPAEEEAVASESAS